MRLHHVVLPSLWLVKLFSAAVSVSAASYPQFSASSVPSTASYTYAHNLTLTTSADLRGSLAFYWSILDKGTATETLKFMLLLSGFPPLPSPSALNLAWMGVAFGPDMRHSEFIICHLNHTNASMHMNEHFSQPGYAPPTASTLPFAAKAIGGGFVNGTMWMELTRLTNPNDGVHATLSSINPNSMLWAYNPQSLINSAGTPFYYHGANGPDPSFQTHGIVSIGLSDGFISTLPLISYTQLLAHGFGMACMYLILIPLGIIMSRYLKNYPGWIYLHASIQVSGVVGVAIFLGVVLMTYQNYSGSHARLGLTIIILTRKEVRQSAAAVHQIFAGGFTRYWMINGDMKSITYLRYLHRFNGFSILIMSVVQVALGLNIAFPNTETRGSQYWYAYAFVVAFWVVAFICVELFWCVSLGKLLKYRSVSTAAEDGTASKKPLLNEYNGNVMFVGGRGKNNNNNNNSVNNLNNNSNNTRIPSDKLDFLLAQHSKQAASSTSTSSGLKQYTWKSLNEEISTSQRILVVGNGKYVYDATQWIHSHPGGKVILYSVSGTDISMDYFMEAGYDAAQFVPAPLRPTRSYAVADVPMYSGGEGNIIPDSNITTTSEDAVAYAMQNASYLTQEDWILVEKSRRTHIHSRLALERLSKILVGEIVADHRDTVVSSSSSNGLRPDQMTVAAVDGVPFDAFEYRRYTLTEKVLLTDDGKANVAIWKIKFTALYPYDVRDGQPSNFLQGQAVEIQIRLSDGSFVSRYYTPILGNLTSFEIIVKMTGGAMTSYLDRQRPGDKQFKIRGPFGGPFVAPAPAGYEMQQPIPPKVVFITAGSGITPFLQFLTTTMLPLNEALSAWADYEPQNSDEIALRKGEFVATQSHYWDGWAFGTNLMTGQQGIFPLSIVTPKSGRNYKLILINVVNSTSEIVGRELLDAAMLSYPQQIEVHHVVASLSSGIRDGVTGYIREGRLDERICREILHDVIENGTGYSRRAVICGPGRFNATFVDVLVDSLGWQQSEITSLSESSVQ